MKRFTTIFILLTIFSRVNPQAQTNIAVLDLEGKNVPQTEASILTDKLRGELYNTGQFQIIERARMNEILQEQGFQQTGCVSDECIVEVGKLIGVERVVAGSIGKVGEIYLISVRLIDVSQGKIIRNVDEMIEGSIGEVLKTGIASIANKLVTDEPAEAPPPPTVGTLSITSAPSNAQITIDGATTPQKTPAIVGDLTEGKHIILVSLPGYRDSQKIVNVTAGETAIVDIQLKKIPRPKPPLEFEPLKYSVKVKFSTVAGTMKEYNDWVDDFNQFVIEPDTAFFQGKNLSPFGNLTSLEMQFTYSISPKYGIGLVIGRLAGQRHYVARNESRGELWEHKFAIGNLFESAVFYYSLIPPPSRLYGTLAIGLDFYQSTIDFKNNYDYGEDEYISKLTASGIGFQAGLGLGYNFTSRLGIEINLNWRASTIKGYSGTIKNYSYRNLQSEDDAILFSQFGYYGAAPKSWLEGPGTRKEGTVDLTGLQISGGLVFSF